MLLGHSLTSKITTDEKLRFMSTNGSLVFLDTKYITEEP